MNRQLYATIAARSLAIGLVTFLAGCGTLKEAKLRVPTWFGLEEIAPSVYASRDTTDLQRGQLVLSLSKARSQVIEVYGSVASSPVVYACANRDCYESFNGYGDGRAVGESGILLLPKTFIPEALSHEWSHVELYARVGRSGYRQIPMWFHEGLAVVVSKLQNHSEETLQQAEKLGLPIPKNIKELGGLKVWSDALQQYQNAKGLNIVYAAAGHELRKWYIHVGQQGLLDLLQAVKSGEKFSAAYHRIGERSMTSSDNASKLRFEADVQKQRAAQL